MQTVAFRMRVHPGCEAEYRRRHDALWPELAALLRERGIEDYRIFLDGETRALFAVLRCPEPAALDELRHEPVMQQWWAHMADIMDTHADASPVTMPLEEVFSLP